MSESKLPVRCRACCKQPSVQEAVSYWNVAFRARVRCKDWECWDGPWRRTPQEAIAAWNAVMRKEEEKRRWRKLAEQDNP